MTSYPYDREVAAAVTFAPAIDLTEIRAARDLLVEAAAQAPSFQPEPGVDLVHLAAHGSGESPPVDVYVARPSGEPIDRGRPALLWFHGGGLVVGDAWDWLPLLDAAARQSTVHGSSGIAEAADVSRRQNADPIAAFGRALRTSAPADVERI
jgi:acetyl esterase/lipase